MALCAAAATPNCGAQVDSPTVYGLVGQYSDAAGRVIERLDRRPEFAWVDAPPDARLGEGPYSAVWRGSLLIPEAGTYQLLVYAAGRFSLQLDGQVLLDGQQSSPAWFETSTVELSAGEHPLVIDWRQQGSTAEFKLYWRGPRFQLEPVPETNLVHDPRHTPDEAFERGQQLVRALRCAACHRHLDDGALLPAAALDRLRGNIRPEWLVQWLSEEPSPNSQRRMPHFRMSRPQARSVAAFLLEGNGNIQQPIRQKGDSDQGRQLLLTVGCLACHTFENLGTAGLFTGGDLTHIAQKRPPDFFVRWLADPAQINTDHRMPPFDLDDSQRRHLGQILSECGGPVEAHSETLDTNNHLAIAEGRQLTRDFRCGACHRLPGGERPEPARAWTAKFDAGRSCAGGTNTTGTQPVYALNAADVVAVHAYLQQVVRPQPARGEQLLIQRGCTNCHARNSRIGIAEVASEVVDRYPELAPHLPAMTPPALTGAGDKLHRHALVDAITNRPQLRPWLKVRMPRYQLPESELLGLVEHLIAQDRIAAGPPRTSSLDERLAGITPQAIRLAGERLVTADGFGCNSCHAIGDQPQPDATLAALGPNLAQCGGRIRQAWFERWVRNPARIVPRMEMPSVQLPVHGVLGENLDQQIAAVWKVLNLEDFEPPQSDAVRIVRRSGDPQSNEPSVVLTDVLRHEGITYIKPLLVALPNRHNILIDLQTNRLIDWWIGDAARQRTEGKSWYWQSAGTSLWPAASQSSDIRLGVSGQFLAPAEAGQFVTEIDELQHHAGGIQLTHRVQFAGPDTTRQLAIRQHFDPIWDTSRRSGCQRELVIQGLQSGDQLAVQVFDPAIASWQIASNRREVEGSKTGIGLEIIEPADARFDSLGRVVLDGLPDGRPRQLALRYLTRAAVDRYPPPADAAKAGRAQPVTAVPGFVGVRLPLSRQIMPTALAWRSDGALVIASLKGRIWLAQDTDGDGLEDRTMAMSDELAAPYGLATGDGYIDVINKYALLRLWDADHDGHAERMTTLASGWGHTDDYHDWTVGLISDEQGNYYVATACQQDDRSVPAARLRGAVLRLQPRCPDAGNPQLFSVHCVSRGHRFPMGLARSREGELFVTDNQGNYNPFNELNHVQAGAHYGFINALDKGARPPKSLTPPAINIPHPWTRSVNGICFLDTPQQSADSSGFGPFEGHLVGCEYDTRRLVRMSLQKVGEKWQGAVYPMSLADTPQPEGLLGPLACAVSPGGELYVGCIRDSGWGGANNIGAVVRLRMVPDDLPAGIAEIRAVPGGFAVRFTRAVDEERGVNPANYRISSFTRTSTPAYGGDDQQRRLETIRSVHLTADKRQATIELEELREGFVYEFQLRSLVDSAQDFFPAEAFYTLNAVPQ